MILGGDFNTYLNPTLDKNGGKSELESNYAKQLKSVCKEFDLIDIWRLNNPKEKRFTWRDNTRAGFVQSRLDYFFISRHLNYLILKTLLKPGFRSDHSLINIQIELLQTQKRGKGYWKFNNSLLYDKTYVSLVKEELKKLSGNQEIQDKSCFWDFVKCQIRTITISYCRSLAHQRRTKERFLLGKIEDLEKNFRSDSHEYNMLKKEWENLHQLKTEGAIMRSKVDWAEHGEKNTKFFLNLEKKNYNLKYIKKLIINDSVELRKPAEILEEEKQFYKNLYTSKISGGPRAGDDFLSAENIPRLKDSDKKICDAPLSLEEIAKATKELKNDKSPGSDGLSTNFYKFFWPDIKLFLFDSYKDSFKNNLLSRDQRRGILNLIPKPNKDLCYLKNWRPVSILNTDYKILTKALSNRLQPILPEIVSSDQVGYIKDRQITENIRIINDIMTYTELKHIPGFISLIDFEKAFDSVEWPFLLKTLEAFNFGNTFIRWISILYTKIQSCVSNNGYFQITLS